MTFPTTTSLIPLFVPLLALGILLAFRLDGTPRKVIVFISLIVSILCGTALMIITSSQEAFAISLTGAGSKTGTILYVDALSSLMMVLVNLSLLFIFVQEESETFDSPSSTSFALLLTSFSVTTCLFAADLLTLFFAWEIFAVTLWLNTSPHPQRRIVRHVIASLCFLLGMGLTYALCGSWNFARVYGHFNALGVHPGIALISILFTLSLVIRIGVLPIPRFVLADAPQEKPLQALEILLPVVGIVTFLRLAGFMLPASLDGVYLLLILLGSVTLLSGILTAASETSQPTASRAWQLLLFANMGIITMGAGLFNPVSISASILHLIQYVLLGLACVLGRRFPLPSPYDKAFAVILTLSLLGLPPLCGFWGRYALTVNALMNPSFLLGIVIFASVLLSLPLLSSLIQSLTKPLASDESQEPTNKTFDQVHIVPIILILVILTLPLMTQPLIDYSNKAAEQVLNRFEHQSNVNRIGDRNISP